MDSADGPEDQNSYQTTAESQRLTFYLTGCTGTAVCCIGIVANLLCLAVLTKKCMRSSNTNLYLCALSVADTMVLLMSVLVFLKNTRPDFESPEFIVWRDFPAMPHVYMYSHAMNLVFQVASVWLTVAFTADRYLMICHPFLAERLCSRRLVGQVVAAIFTCSALYTLPRLFEHEIFTPRVPDFLAHMNDTELERLESDLVQTQANGQAMAAQLRQLVRGGRTWYHLSKLGATSEYRIYYHLVAWLIVVVLLPFASLAVMNAFLMRAVQRARQRGRRLSGSGSVNGAVSSVAGALGASALNRRPRTRNDTTVMLIGVIVLFFVCQIPAAIMHAMWSTRKVGLKQDLLDYAFQDVSNLLVVLNSAINIVPYCLFSGKFRRQLLRTLLCCGWCARKIGDSLQNHNVRRLPTGHRSNHAQSSRHQQRPIELRTPPSQPLQPEPLLQQQQHGKVNKKQKVKQPKARRQSTLSFGYHLGPYLVDPELMTLPV